MRRGGGRSRELAADGARCSGPKIALAGQLRGGRTLYAGLDLAIMIVQIAAAGQLHSHLGKSTCV